MGSEHNDATSFSPSEPMLCANGCGFFGTPSNMNLCSKCYRDIRAKEEQDASAKAAVEKSFNPPSPKSQPPVDPTSAEVVKVAVSDDRGKSLEVVSEVVSDKGDGGGEPVAANRCFSCKKKVGLTGFKCKCGSTYCGSHRYPENHECSFDFKASGRDAIAKANPLIKADKVNKI